MPVLVPGVQPWAAFLAEGANYTLSADLETLTATDPVRSPWYDTGATLARVQWDGTATGTIKGRSSAARPPFSGLILDDRCPIQPGDSEWAYQYLASLGTVPGSQGFTKNGAITETYPSGTTFRAQTTGGFYGITSTGSLSATADLTVIRTGFMVNTGHNGLLEFYYDDGTKRFLWYVTGSAYGGDANKLLTAFSLAASVATVPYDTWCDVIVVIRRSSGTVTDSRMYFRQRGSYTRTDLLGFTDVGTITLLASSGNLIGWGNGYAANGTDVTVDHLGWYSGGEWETVTDGDTSFAVNRQYWQLRGWQSGTLTELDLAASLAAPGDPSGPQASAIGSTAIGGNCTSTAAGAAAYWVELLDAGNADAVVADRWELEPAATFRGLSAGSYKVRFTSASDDGVRGSSAATTSSTAVPAVAPTIALAISDTTLDPGQTVTVTPTITGSLTATLGGAGLTNGVAANVATANAVTVAVALSAATVAPGDTVTATVTPQAGVTTTIDGAGISGTPTTVVTGVSGGALIGPSAAVPAIANLTSRPQAIIGYQGSAMRIILPTTRPSTWTLQRSSDGLTGWVTDSSQSSPTINDSALTYSGAVVGTSYATDHGWTLNASYYYAILPTYSDGSIGQRSNVIRPSAAADYECSVSGTMPLLVDGTCHWADDTGEVVISEAVTLGGRLYPRTGYSFTIASNGTWSVSVPRLAAASQVDGGTSTLLAEFRFPDGSRVAKVIPDSASAAFSALTAG